MRPEKGEGEKAEERSMRQKKEELACHENPRKLRGEAEEEAAMGEMKLERWQKKKKKKKRKKTLQRTRMQHE